MPELHDDDLSVFRAFIEDELDMLGLAELPPIPEEDDIVPADSERETLRDNIERIWARLMTNDGPNSHWQRCLTSFEQEVRDALQELLFEHVGIPRSGEVVWSSIGDCITLSWLVMAELIQDGLDDEDDKRSNW